MMTEDMQKLSLAVVEDLKNKGFNQSEIAEMFGVTRQYVSWIKQTYGGSKTPREEVMEQFPLPPLPREHGQTSPFKRLRDHGEYIATNGKGMSDDQVKRLKAWWKKLYEQDLILEYDPDIPPEPGVSKAGGWAYRKRTPEERKERYVLRMNKYTKPLTDRGKMIWRIPLKHIDS